MATVAARVAQSLSQAGVRHAFGIPGAEVLALVDALAREGIAFHLVKHETAGGFMADAVAQLTGAPGVLIGTLGPGATNMTTAVANARLDRTPMVILTGAIDPRSASTHMVLDHAALFSPICKRSITLAQGCSGAMIDETVGLASSGVPGPVHMDIPVNFAGSEVAEGSPAETDGSPANHGIADLQTLADWLAEAERPLILAGIGVLRHAAHEELRRLVRTTGAAVITSYKAKGVVPEDDSLVVGASSLSTVADRALFKVVRAADLILCVGFDPVEVREAWGQPWERHTRSASLGWAPQEHEVFRTRLEVTGNVRAKLAGLLSLLPKRSAAAWKDGLPDRCRREAEASMRPLEEGAWGPHAVIETCRKAFPRETIATADTGAHRILLSQVWSSYEPHGLLQSTGLATMGYGLSSAIGAKIARPDRPVVCFTGDGGLEMFLGELATLRDLRLPVAIVCFADRSLALIELKQRRSRLRNLGVDFPATDFCAVARAFGGEGVTVRNRRELESACRGALEAKTFSLIEALIDKAEYDGQIL